MSFLDQKKLSLIYENILKEKYYNDILNPNFWENGIFSKDVQKKLIQIARDFYDSLDIEASILDIQLTGSLANYNYTEYSDLDVHIIIDFKEINKDKSLVKMALDGLRFIWNQRHDIIIRGHDVELYIQDETEQHTASGLYSLLQEKWIRKPRYNPPEIDERDVELKYEEYVKEIAKLDEKISQRNTPKEYLSLRNRAKKLKEKIQKGRKECLSGEEASEFCVENLVFKKLRNTGMIEKLIEIMSHAYDEAYSEI